MLGENFEKQVYVARDNKDLSMKNLLDITVSLGASDLHLVSEDFPRFRMGSDLLPYEQAAKLVDGREHDTFSIIDAQTIESLVYTLFSTEQQTNMLEKRKSVDLSIKTEKARFRVNIAREDRGLYATMRVIPYGIREISKLGFPNDIWKKIINENQGLTLVTGMTGSGKSTTLASLIQEIVRTRHVKVITIENPIEYAFRDAAGKVIQRELGRDTLTFFDGVIDSFRQDPDIIMIGETRDSDTAQEALRAAETGHLVFTTLHTKDAISSIERYVDLFPTDRQNEIKALLADNLKYVLSQQLIPYERSSKERVLAMEIMVVTSAISHLIRAGKTDQVKGYVQQSSKEGAISMENHLAYLCGENKITSEMAMHYARDKNEMQRLLKK